MADEEHIPLGRSRRIVMFANMMITCIALAIISTATSTALGPLCADFRIDASLGQWVTSGYSLVLGVGTLLTAYLATRFPSRPLYIIAVGVITASLACAAAAPTFEVLMVARICQALGNALISSLTMICILSIFPEGEKGTAMGFFGTTQGAAVIIGPVLGGLLVDLFGWRALFWAIGAVCAASFVLAMVCMRTVLPLDKTRFDAPSFVLAGVAFAGVTYGIGALAGAANSAVPVIILIVAVASGAAFVRRQLRLDQPFLDVRLFCDRTFCFAVLLSMLLYAILMGTSTVVPLYIEMSLGDSATAAGGAMVPGALVMAVFAPIVGKAFDRAGIRWLALGGGLLMLVGNAGMLISGFSSATWAVAVLYTIRCAGIVMVQMPLITWGLSRLGTHDMAHGQALLTALRNVAGSIGAAAFASLMSAVGTAGSAGMMAAFAGIAVCSAAFLIVAAVNAR